MHKIQFKAWLGLGITLFGSLGMGLSLIIADIIYPNEPDSTKAGFYIICIICFIIWFWGLMLCVIYKNNNTTIKAEGILSLICIMGGIILFAMSCFEKRTTLNNRLILSGGYSLFLGFGLGVPFVIAKAKTWYVYYNNQVLYACFPKEYKKDITKIIKILRKDKSYAKWPINTYYIDFKLNPLKIIKVPTRLYFKEIKEKRWRHLNDTQKLLISCLYTRSANGYVREKYLRYLLNSVSPLAIPFIVYSGSDYVKEIVDTLYLGLKDKNNQDLKYYCLYNGKFLKTHYDRMLSYWAYYERENTPRYKEYVGYKLFNECFGLTQSLYKRS